MVQPNSRRPRRLSRITLCVVLIVLGCQSPLSVRTAAAAGSGPEVIQGLGNYFLTLPYGGIKWPSPCSARSSREWSLSSPVVTK